MHPASCILSCGRSSDVLRFSDTCLLTFCHQTLVSLFVSGLSSARRLFVDARRKINLRNSCLLHLQCGLFCPTRDFLDFDVDLNLNLHLILSPSPAHIRYITPSYTLYRNPQNAPLPKRHSPISLFPLPLNGQTSELPFEIHHFTHPR